MNMLDNELRIEDPASYRNFVRMDEEAFNLLLSYVEPYIKKLDTTMREVISVGHRLAITLRFLATGESFRSLMYSTWVHESTISLFVPEVCRAIFEQLKDDYLKIPSTEEEWLEVSTGFERLWNFPNCLGAIDGKHINFSPPRSAGSYYYNYKGNHSIVLLAVCDAFYKLLYIHVGVNGRNSDGGVFRESTFKKAPTLNLLNLPADAHLPGTNVPVPYVFVADEAFPLLHNLIKPYAARGLTNSQRIFNYRLSRARRVIENCFGILANRWRILLTTINLCPEKVELITLACCVLHNFLIKKNFELYTEQTEKEQLGALQQNQGPNRSTLAALRVRNKFCTYFSTVGIVPWQNEICFNT